jgi:citrate synthase
LSAATLALGESSADDLRLENTAQAARRLLFAFAGAIGTLGPQREFKISEPGTSMAQCVLQALGSEPDPDKEEAINALMICAADHELSPPTFAARVCASSHAGLHACVLAAIGAHSGYRLGRGCDRVEDLLDSFSDEADMRGKVLEQLRRSQQMPGFNLMLYPHGDPRAVTLLNVAASFQGVSRARITEAAIELIKAESGQLPNIEVALVAVTQALGLPRRSAGALWALARTAGWVAHVIEQRLSGDEIRPRAKFT